jgi:hypothetical protein
MSTRSENFCREYENDLLRLHELLSQYAKKFPDAVNGEQYQRGWWNLFKSYLQMGALADGVRLSPDECNLLLDIISGEQKPFKRRGRPRVDKTAVQQGFSIAKFVELLEADSWPPDAAVERAVEVYGVARRTVFNAKKHRKEQGLQLRSWDRKLTAEARQKKIEAYEHEAAKQRHPRCSRPARRCN